MTDHPEQNRCAQSSKTTQLKGELKIPNNRCYYLHIFSANLALQHSPGVDDRGEDPQEERVERNLGQEVADRSVVFAGALLREDDALRDERFQRAQAREREEGHREKERALPVLRGKDRNALQSTKTLKGLKENFRKGESLLS